MANEARGQVNLESLEWRIAANAGSDSKRGCKPRWSHVADVTALGRGYSMALCIRAGFDPDEEVGEPITVECEACEGAGHVDGAECGLCCGEGWVFNVED